MFDVGFWELLLIGIIALIVIGPNRLPQVASKLGKFMGKINRLVGQFKEDINVELKAEELKKTLAEQAESIGVDEIVDDLKADTALINQQIKLSRDELLQDASVDDLATLETVKKSTTK